jgi:phosphatidylserine decarboxylase
VDQIPALYDRLYALYENSRWSTREIEPFIRKYHVDMAEFGPVRYRSFAEFFDRRFRPGVRRRGYEVQIDDRGLDPKRQVLDSAFHLTGAIYELAPAIRRCSRPIGQWNRFEVAARGPILAVKLNGEAVSFLENASRQPSGHIGLQNHHGGSAVQFRDLRVMTL